MRPPSAADTEAYAAAVTRSRGALSEFAVPDPHNLPVVLATSRRPTAPSWSTRCDPRATHGLVGRINVANVVEGAFRSATIGYDAYDPYVGRGLFAEGLAPRPRPRVRRRAAGDGPAPGRGEHPADEPRSAGLVRSLGFVHEGFSRDFLHLPGIDGRRDWRDHDRYTMLSTDWPAVPYRPHGPRRVACVVRGAPGYAARASRRPLAARARRAALLVGDRGAPPCCSSCCAPRRSVVSSSAGPAGPSCGWGWRGPVSTRRRVPVLEAAVDVPKREVVRQALAVRAAYA